MPSAFDRATVPIRVVLDLRPLQQPDGAPVTALYLRNLLAAFSADPVEGETFVALLQAGLPDPIPELPDLPVVGRRHLPPTRLLKAAALTVDPFLLRGAEVATGFRSGAKVVYHVAGADLPLASRAPVVATLLDIAPWELAATFQATAAARFGYRLRARILRQAAAVIVGTESVALQARKLLHVPAHSLRVVPFAGSLDAGAFAGVPGTAVAGSARYHVFFARYDARSDARTLFDALRLLRDRPRPADLPDDVPWPPVLVLLGASPDDRAELARTSDRRDVADLIRYAPYGSEAESAAIVAGARAAVIPVTSDAAGLQAIDALGLGTPVVASAIDGLPEIVGPAGVLVEPRDPERLARAIAATWTEDALRDQLVKAAAASIYATRTWADVARATRDVYRASAR